MIDTIKIFAMINKDTYDVICNNTIIKTSYNSGTGEIYYKLVNDSLKGSYDSNLSVRVGEGIKYHFIDNYYIEIEGSYHKIVRGYNSHNGFYNIVSICKNLISFVETSYNISLPDIHHWFLQRVDIACCFDLHNNKSVADYINNLSLCSYPRRNIKHYQDESIYTTGTTTTLKIYNKKLEFKKHDLKKFIMTNFNLDNYLATIDGFIRFECDLNIVRSKEDIERRLFTCYSSVKARNLYNFYLSLVVDGYRVVKKRTSKSSFYRNVKDLKSVNIDINQKYKLDLEREIIDFNPFEYKEVV